LAYRSDINHADSTSQYSHLTVTCTLVFFLRWAIYLRCF